METHNGPILTIPAQWHIHRAMLTDLDEVAQRVLGVGKGALMAKFDLKAAYRNVPVHPDDREMVWKDQLFVDTTLPLD